jgi:hypothetical protein
MTAGAALSDTLRIKLSTTTPWFAHYSLTANGETSDQSADELNWKLKPGVNVLDVREVNQGECQEFCV